MRKLLFAFCLILVSYCFSQTTVYAQTKKDGSPDMRFKENKEKKEVKKSEKLKADGTPDMRFKENKNKKEENEPKGKLKADGTPDKRYKENQSKNKKK